MYNSKTIISLKLLASIESMLKEWNVSIISVYIKCDRSDCKKKRNISFLSVTYKILLLIHSSRERILELYTHRNCWKNASYFFLLRSVHRINFVTGVRSINTEHVKGLDTWSIWTFVLCPFGGSEAIAILVCNYDQFCCKRTFNKEWHYYFERNRSIIGSSSKQV